MRSAANKILLTDSLIKAFNVNWKKWVYTTHKNSLYLPFFHMRSESFWKLLPKEGKEFPLTSSNSIKSLSGLQESLAYAELDEGLFLALCDPVERTRLKVLLTKRYFPHIPVQKNDYVRDLYDIEQNILNSSPAEYRSKMEQLRKSTDKETYTTIRTKRNTLFSKVVVGMYNHRCCISGMRVMCEDDTFLLDGCHIVPHNVSLDDTVGNGLSLCPNLHRAFDKGLIGIDESSYKVIVSEEFDEDERSAYSLRQFEGREIGLPHRVDQYPLQENLYWHRRNVFRG